MNFIIALRNPLMKLAFIIKKKEEEGDEQVLGTGI